MGGAEQGPREPSKVSRQLVLVVDDDPGQRIACRELLQEAGYAIIEAGDGRQALDVLMERKQAQPTIILLDLSMPIMDGWEFLAIMKSYVRLHAIPVILLSAYEPTLDPVKHGTIAAYLHKPYDSEALVSLVRELADRTDV